MPTTENIPLVWDEDSLNNLSGTELDGMLDLDREQMALEVDLTLTLYLNLNLNL